MKRVAAGCLLASLVVASSVHAGLVDFSFGAGGWDAAPSGNINYSSSGIAGTAVDLKSDLGLTSSTQAYLWGDFEHPVPLLPNLRLEYAGLKTSGEQVLSRSVVYGGSTYTVSTPVTSNASIKQSDLILYWSPLNNWLKLDLGLDVKYLDMRFRLSGGGQTTQAKGSAVVPMLYGNAAFQIPATSLSFGVSGSFSGYGGSSFSDLRARVAYVFGDHIGVEAGYRRLHLKINSNSIDTNGDIRFGGGYLGLFATF